MRVLDAEAVARLNRMEKKLRNIRFAGMSGSSTEESITIGPPFEQPEPPPADVEDPLIVLVGSPITYGSTLAGLYDGTIYRGAATIAATTDLTLPAGLTAGDSCLLINAEEDSAIPTSAGTSRLQSGVYVSGLTYLGQSGEAPPRPMFLIGGPVGRVDSPKNLPTGGLTPDSTGWSLNTDGKPLTIDLVTGVFWDGTHGKLVQNTRTFSFDARGVLRGVTIETATTVDTTGTC